MPEEYITREDQTVEASELRHEVLVSGSCKATTLCVYVCVAAAGAAVVGPCEERQCSRQERATAAEDDGSLGAEVGQLRCPRPGPTRPLPPPADPHTTRTTRAFVV